MSSPVMQALHNQRLQEASAWGRWAILHKLRPLPASPADVARFIRDAEPLALIDEIFKWVGEISASHLENGYADPTAGGQATAAMNAISKLEPPRSWRRDMKERFFSLPWDVQDYLTQRENQRDREVRKAQNEAGDARQKLISLQKITTGKSDDSKSKQTAA
jgi:hypothetical protein